ncbi:MAG: cytochrome c3 family protein [Dehalococcoidia bacterium]|nr:cytochrome c3 family protein [Dehalococcoidia bacterium]
MNKERRAGNTAWAIAVAAVVALAGLWAASALTPGAASAAPPSPHLSASATTDTCAACHRSHTGQNDNLLKDAVPQSTLCFSCHDGTGANYNVAAEFSAEFSDGAVFANVPATSSLYSHPATTASTHTSAQVDEFAGMPNRHSECSDCHNPHTVSDAATTESGSGWTASGALTGASGVAASTPLAWKNPISYEYELCLKCHSGYTQLLSYSKESYKKTDKAAEFDPSTASYHPVEAAGKNTTTEMAASLAGGSLWQFTTASTIRCVNCHGDYRSVAGTPTPAADARLAPHTSPYRGILIANYRDRDLKPRDDPYRSTDFTLCYLCHSEAPFSAPSDVGRPDTNFRLHAKHLVRIGNVGTGGLDIDDTAGAGQGNAICAECHYRLHGTSLAPWADNQDYSRGVNFAPDVQPRSGQTNPPGPPSPLWSGPTSPRTCSLICHGKDHDAESY